MNTPGFAAASSLYKTGQIYRGYSGAAGVDSTETSSRHSNSLEPATAPFDHRSSPRVASSPAIAGVALHGAKAFAFRVVAGTRAGIATRTVWTSA
jgi:hypothetical protein